MSTRWLTAGAGAVVLFAALVGLRIGAHYPGLPRPLLLTLALEPGIAGRADPVLVTGRPEAGDFLSVRFDDAGTVRFTYDSWGFPARVSAPVALPTGGPLHLQLELPALDHMQGGDSPTTDRVRVTCDGVIVLDSAAHAFLREPDRIFFGENPLGGTACGPALHGRISMADGRVIHGGADAFFSYRERIADWVRRFPGQVLTLALAAGLAGWWLIRLPAPGVLRRRATQEIVRHRWFLGAAAPATLVFAWLVTFGSFRLNVAEPYGSFYDYQAASLLRGRLDVPEDAIGGEAFEANGKLYGYFGPTPALLRLPWALSGLAFGKLSRAYMLLYFVATLAAGSAPARRGRPRRPAPAR